MLPAVLREMVKQRPQALLALEVPRRTGAEGAADADAAAAAGARAAIGFGVAGTGGGAGTGAGAVVATM